MSMDQTIKSKWITALRSGEYKQVGSYLHKGDGYCCLGVLCELSALGEWEQATPDHIFVYRGQSGMPDNEVLEITGLRKQDADTLSSMNDEGKSFPEIAAYIEQNL